MIKEQKQEMKRYDASKKVPQLLKNILDEVADYIGYRVAKKVPTEHHCSMEGSIEIALILAGKCK